VNELEERVKRLEERVGKLNEEVAEHAHWFEEDYKAKAEATSSSERRHGCRGSP
jgi:hypothetical protein